MHTLRKYLSWSFAFTSFVCLQVTFSIGLRPIREQATFRFLYLLTPALFTAFSFVFAAAWWGVFKEKSSAWVWGIAASMINIAVALAPVVVPPHSIWNGFLLILALGVAGLIAFSRRPEPMNAASQEHRAVPGDGTSKLLNNAVQFISLLVMVGGYSWWLSWLNVKGIPLAHQSWYPTLVAVIIGLALVTLHEMGHAAIGLVLGMKLRAFVVGPFQWRIQDGRWHFQFRPKEILVPGGATGIVPTVTNFPRWAHLSMIAAGPFANALTGAVALWAAMSAEPSSPIQAGGFLALFGVWSLAMCALNLIPFRTNINYSDGAQIYQLLSNGPWGDFHRAVALVGASLVSPLRPRDYDIAALLRAASRINDGKRGMLLRLYAFSYFLDQGKFTEAGSALGEAALIYNQSPSDISAELLTPFVFGSAYILRDSSGARQWWTHLEAKKPTRFNGDYWLASSALHWIEGNFQDANEAWEKANALAQGPLKAGAYEFDRYCCSLLRHALYDSPVVK